MINMTNIVRNSLCCRMVAQRGTAGGLPPSLTLLVMVGKIVV